MEQQTVKLKWVALASLLNNTGAAFLWPLTTMYLHNYLGQTLTTAGFVMLIMSIAMMMGNYLGGWLFDHWKQYQTAMTNMGIPFYAYSMLWTLNGVLIIIGQPLVNKLSPYVRLSTQIIVGIFIFALSFLLLIFARTLTAFVIDFVILTIGEMTSFAGLPAWIAQLTNVDEAGHYQGLLNIMMSVGRAIGPLYGGFVIEKGSYQFLFISVFCLMTGTLIIICLYLWHLHRVQRRLNLDK